MFVWSKLENNFLNAQNLLRKKKSFHCKMTFFTGKENLCSWNRDGKRSECEMGEKLMSIEMLRKSFSSFSICASCRRMQDGDFLTWLTGILISFSLFFFLLTWKVLFYGNLMANYSSCVRGVAKKKGAFTYSTQ